MPKQDTPPAAKAATPTTVSRPMMLALADLLNGSVSLAAQDDRWINALTRRALIRRRLAVVNGGRVCITNPGRLVVNAYLLGAEAEAERTASNLPLRCWS